MFVFFLFKILGIHMKKLQNRDSHHAYKDLCQIFVDFCPVFRRFASDKWKGCFQWAEGTFLKSGSGASDGWKNGRDWDCLILKG